jgi:hypothetical protein
MLTRQGTGRTWSTQPKSLVSDKVLGVRDNGYMKTEATPNVTSLTANRTGNGEHIAMASTPYRMVCSSQWTHCHGLYPIQNGMLRTVNTLPWPLPHTEWYAPHSEHTAWPLPHTEWYAPHSEHTAWPLPHTEWYAPYSEHIAMASTPYRMVCSAPWTHCHDLYPIQNANDLLHSARRLFPQCMSTNHRTCSCSDDRGFEPANTMFLVVFFRPHVRQTPGQYSPLITHQASYTLHNVGNQLQVHS